MALKIRRDPRTHYNLGMQLHQQEHKYDAAIFQYERAIELDPYYKKPTNNIAAALFAIGEPTKAREWLLRVLELDPNHQEAKNNLVILDKKMGKGHVKREAKNIDAMREAKRTFDEDIIKKSK